MLRYVFTVMPECLLDEQSTSVQLPAHEVHGRCGSVQHVPDGEHRTSWSCVWSGRCTKQGVVALLSTDDIACFSTISLYNLYLSYLPQQIHQVTRPSPTKIQDEPGTAPLLMWEVDG